MNPSEKGTAVLPNRLPSVKGYPSERAGGTPPACRDVKNAGPCCKKIYPDHDNWLFFEYALANCHILMSSVHWSYLEDEPCVLH